MADAERKQRRKLQNRINQRARRNRMNNDDTPEARTKQQRPAFGVKLWRIDEFDLKTEISLSESDDNEHAITKQDPRLFLTTMYKGILNTADVELYSQQLDMHRRLRVLTGGPSPLSDQLLYLINYNAFRGLFQNKVTLSQVTDHLAPIEGRTEKLDVMSGLKRDAICVATDLGMPPHLRPTALQSSRVHATWIDLIPFPKMRDNLIAHHDDFNHRLLVTDILGDLLEDIMFNKYGQGTGPKGHRLISKGKPGDYTADRRETSIIHLEPILAIMTIARQSLSSFRHLPTVTSALRVQPALSSYTFVRMNSAKVRNPVSADPNHDKNNPPVADHADGAMASLKGAPGKRDASSFEDKNMTEKEKNINSQNAQEPDSREGSAGKAGHFKKSGRKPKM
ncbi:hypothetical protein IL306_001556 [Fusarium sp. DS 682]|nr:hypothetical protein IL306_001556 [Fusarium sp. DS 682]